MSGPGVSDILLLEPRVVVYGIDPATFGTDILGRARASNSWIVGHEDNGYIVGAPGGGTPAVVASQAASDAIADITCWVKEIQASTCQLPRSTDSWTAGSMQLTLEAPDRRFDPGCAYEAYTPSAAGVWTPDRGPVNLFRVGQRIRLGLYDPVSARIKHWLWSGFIDEISPSYGGPLLDTFRTTVRCIDAFGVLGRYDGRASESAQGDGDYLSQRIRRIGAMVGWGVRSAQDLVAHPPIFATAELFRDANYGYRDYGLGAYSAGLDGTSPFVSTNLADNALTAMKLAATSEDGHVFVGRDGELTWTTSTDRTLGPYYPNGSSYAAEWTGGGGGVYSEPWFRVGWSASVPPDYPIRWRETDTTGTVDHRVEYVGVARVADPIIPDDLWAHDLDDVVTMARCSRVHGDEVEVADAEAIQTYGQVVWARTNLQLASDVEVYNLAYARIQRHKQQVSRLRHFTLAPALDSHAMLIAATANLTQRFVFDLYLGDGHALTRTAYFAGFKHTIRPGKSWSMDVQAVEAL